MKNLTNEEMRTLARRFGEDFRRHEMLLNKDQEGYDVEIRGQDYAWSLMYMIEEVELDHRKHTLDLLNDYLDK